MSRVIAYIDGFNLYYGIRAATGKRFLWLDIQQMMRQILKPGQQLMHTRYFTSRVSATPTDPDKPRRQAVFVEALQTLQGLTIYFGHYLDRPMTCRNCGATWVDHDEKMTDVNIATELLTDAFDDLFDTALLVTADSDLTRPIQTVLKRFPHKRVVMAFPPARSSERLRNVASAYLTIGRNVLRASQFAMEVQKPDGFVLRRPKEWQ